MPATKKRQQASSDPLSQFRDGVDGLAQHLRSRRAMGWDPGSFEQIAHEIDRLHGQAVRLDPRWAGMLAQLHSQMSAARVAQHMPDAASTAQLISVVENLLLHLPTTAQPAAIPSSKASGMPS